MESGRGCRALRRRTCKGLTSHCQPEDPGWRGYVPPCIRRSVVVIVGAVPRKVRPAEWGDVDSRVEAAKATCAADEAAGAETVREIHETMSRGRIATGAWRIERDVGVEDSVHRRTFVSDDRPDGDRFEVRRGDGAEVASVAGVKLTVLLHNEIPTSR